MYKILLALVSGPRTKTYPVYETESCSYDLNREGKFYRHKKSRKQGPRIKYGLGCFKVTFIITYMC